MSFLLILNSNCRFVLLIVHFIIFSEKNFSLSTFRETYPLYNFHIGQQQQPHRLKKMRFVACILTEFEMLPVFDLD